MNKIKKANTVDTEVQKVKAKKIKRSKRKTVKPKISSGKIKARNKAIKPKFSQSKVKYQSSSRYVKFASKSQLQKHIVNGKYVFTKQQQAQYNLLNKRFGISELEYLKLYYGVRKANAKGARLAKTESSLYHVKYSRKFKNTIYSKEDYLKYMKSISKVLSRDYKERMNREFKERFMQNIEAILTDKAAKNINEIVQQMTASELRAFIDDNPDLEKVMYESDPEKFTTFDKEATSLIENRLRDFLGKPIIDPLFEYDISSTDDLIKRK